MARTVDTEDIDGLAVDAAELERLAGESDAEFRAFIEDIARPLNELRRLARKPPRNAAAMMEAVLEESHGR